MRVCILLAFVIGTALAAQSYSVGRGAQVRLTKNGLRYGAALGIRKLEQELTNKHLDSQSGRSGDFQYTASNIFIKYLRVGSYSVNPVPGNGLSVSVSGINIDASARIAVKYKKGWIKASKTENIKFSGRNVGFTLTVKIVGQNSKPQLQTQSCHASIGSIDIGFDGPFAWLFEGIANLFEGKLKDVLKGVMCTEGRKLINDEANGFLRGFPVQQNIEGYTIIDYSFQTPVATNNYIDFLLRGEFLDPKNPTHSTKQPPSFDTITASNKMAYVWITDFTLNSVGDVFHKTGLLKKLIGPITKEIPDSVKPFLNTKSFKSFIPGLYSRFPDRPISFEVATNSAPTFKLTPGNVHVFLNVRANVVVNQINGTNLPVFYMDLNVNATGSAFVKVVNGLLNVGGNIADFSFSVAIGGSVIGDINIPFNDPSMTQLVKGLVIENANPLLNKGFPIPRIQDLSFVSPQVSFVQNAIRIDTDIKYSG